MLRQRLRQSRGTVEVLVPELQDDFWAFITKEAHKPAKNEKKVAKKGIVTGP